jgi:hypothetical protein
MFVLFMVVVVVVAAAAAAAVVVVVVVCAYRLCHDNGFDFRFELRVTREILVAEFFLQQA